MAETNPKNADDWNESWWLMIWRRSGLFKNERKGKKPFLAQTTWSISGNGGVGNIPWCLLLKESILISCLMPITCSATPCNSIINLYEITYLLAFMMLNALKRSCKLRYCSCERDNAASLITASTSRPGTLASRFICCRILTLHRTGWRTEEQRYHMLQY